tara:strand:- start:1125 stop:1751 length:627 start_codon:yes stop_codon:yes gene_type:complete
MIIIITTNSINLKKHINLKNPQKIKSVGELNLISGNSVSLKDEVLYFKVGESKVELLVGLNWLKNNFNISSIIFFDYVEPLNNNLLGSHIVIPKNIYSIDDPPIEWGNNPLVNKIEISTITNKKIRKSIYKTNYDFFYGDILSIDKKFISATAINELSNLNHFDCLNYLIFTSNKFANENKIDIYNICISKTKSMSNLRYEKLFERLF